MSPGNQAPDLIVLNGNVITMDEARPRAQALAVYDGKFFDVGTNDDVKSLAGAGTRTLDLGGSTVVPGFIDAHAHLVAGGLRHAFMIDCSDWSTRGEIQEELRLKARATPPGDWVAGFKYETGNRFDGNGFNREELDQVSTEHPVVVNDRGGLVYYANSMALENMGVTREGPGDIAGYFDRDPDTGEPNGVLYEKAAELMKFHILKNVNPEQRLQGIRKVCDMFVSSGITSAHDAMVNPEGLNTLLEAKETGNLPLRVYMLVHHNYFSFLRDAGLKTGFGDDRLRLGGIKLVSDGGFTGHTAYLSQPYEGSDERGFPTIDPDDLEHHLMEIRRAGYQPCTHAIGDAAVELVLDKYEKVHQLLPADNVRYRIEHCTLVRPDLVERMKRLNCIATPSSPTVAHYGEELEEIGEERAGWLNAHRTFLDEGICATASSDYPCAPCEPLLGIQSCVTRTDVNGRVWGANQKVSVEEALKIFTLHGAYASFEENIKGSITPGKLADFVVLGDDLAAVDPLTIKDIPVEMTVVGGEAVYEG